MADDSTLWDLSDDPTGPRLLHAGDHPDGKPYLLATDEAIEIAAGQNDRHDLGIAVSGQYGTQVSGPFSISEMPQNIALAGGYWVLNPMLLSCIGSSAAMPIPTLVWSTPKILQGKGDLSQLGAGLGV